MYPSSSLLGRPNTQQTWASSAGAEPSPLPAHRAAASFRVIQRSGGDGAEVRLLGTIVLLGDTGSTDDRTDHSSYKGSARSQAPTAVLTGAPETPAARTGLAAVMAEARPPSLPDFRPRFVLSSPLRSLPLSFPIFLKISLEKLM